MDGAGELGFASAGLLGPRPSAPRALQHAPPSRAWAEPPRASCSFELAAALRAGVFCGVAAAVQWRRSSRAAGRRGATRRWRCRMLAERRSRWGGEAKLMFGGIELHGNHAQWILNQIGSTGQFGPTPIQQRAMRPIFDGESLAVCAPTGTGKTLAYLLPLLERQSFEGGSVLVLVPTTDLADQVVGVAQALTGEEATRVLSLRLILPMTSAKLKEASVVVVTPSRLASASRLPGWVDFTARLTAIVLDEADQLLPHPRERWPAGDVLKRVNQRKNQRPLQVLAVSATMDMITGSRVAEEFDVELAGVTAGSLMDENLRVDDDFDSEDLIKAAWKWPRGVRHYIAGWPNFELRQQEFFDQAQSGQDKTRLPRLFTERGFLRKDVAMNLVARAMEKIRPMPNRCMVIIALDESTLKREGYVAEGTGGARMIDFMKELRPHLDVHGYEVVSASAVVEAIQATKEPNWLASLNRGISPVLAEPRGKQVVVAFGHAARGVDIPDVDAVVIVGKIAHMNQYRHLAGRTGRCRPGKSKDIAVPNRAPATVVAIVDNRFRKKNKAWALKTGLKMNDMELHMEKSANDKVDRLDEDEDDDEFMEDDEFFLNERMERDGDYDYWEQDWLKSEDEVRQY